MSPTAEGGAPAPLPAQDGPLARALERLEAGAAYKATLEAMLLEMERGHADRFMQLYKEGRGAYGLLLEHRAGRLLFVGNAISGSLVALARLGYAVTALDVSERRLAWARHRDRDLVRGDLRVCLDGRDDPGGGYDVVVREEGQHGDGTEGLPRGGAFLGEGGELLRTGDNRLGYKISSGRRADFHVPGPLEYARRVLAGDPRWATLRGWRRRLAADGAPHVRGFALYPHRHDFNHLVALDGGAPRLQIGPKESQNRAKVLGHRLGLFPVLAPSFALIGSRRPSGAARLDAVLERIADATGEPLPSVEHLITTRGNTAIVHTRVPDRDAGDPRGRWTLHVPFSPQQELQSRTHIARLADVRARFPGVPVPEPLWSGEVDGQFVACERRLPGIHTPQLTGGPSVTRRVYGQVVEQLARLVVGRRLVDEALFDALVGAKVDLVARYTVRAGTLERLEAMRAEAREVLLGRELPVVLYHSDLRGKHVQVTPEGEVLGYLDWGSSEDLDLPLCDLLHLVVHDVKQERGCPTSEAWRRIRDRRDLHGFEGEALDRYARAIDLDPEAQTTLERIYPVFVGAMAEGNWDYSRPNWVHENFHI